MARSQRPTTGIFIAWDEEEVDVERRDAGTMQDRTVVTGRRTITKRALYTAKVTDKNVSLARGYAESIKADYENVRVQVFTKQNPRP